MKYFGMPMGMWTLFAGSFRSQLGPVFGYDAAEAKAIAKKAMPEYRRIISKLPEFEKADRFQMNTSTAPCSPPSFSPCRGGRRQNR